MASLDAFWRESALGLDQTFLGAVTPKSWHSTLGTVFTKGIYQGN